MDERLKRRLVGAVVLVSLAVIFLPMLLEDRDGTDTRIDVSNIPAEPPANRPFQSSVLPLADDVPLIPPVTREIPARPAERPPEMTDTGSPDSDGRPAEPRLGVSAWVVQVASLASRANADALAADLKRNGFEAFIEQIYVSGRNLYRIRVGPEIDRKRAESMAGAILEQFKLKGQVVRYP